MTPEYLEHVLERVRREARGVAANTHDPYVERLAEAVEDLAELLISASKEGVE